jgi:predicted Zn-dependent peptidase
MNLRQNFQRKTLSNGIKVIFEKRNIPVVALGIANPFGAINEKEEEKGIAHFIEHLVFTGTKTRTHEDISREIEKRGGILNAYTSQEITCFWFKMPSEHVFKGLDILTDMLNNPLFEKEKFEKEKRVVLEEIKMYHDVPQRAVFESIEKNLFEKPFGIGVIGTKETVASFDRDFVYNFFQENYSPEKFTVSVVGDVDFNKICEYLEEKFVPKNKKYEIQKIKIKNGNSIEERQSIDQSHLVFAMHTPLITDKKYKTLQILNSYLASGMSSKLFLEIREKRGLAYAVKGAIENEKNYSYYAIYVGTTKEKINEIKELIKKGILEISEMTEKDLEEAKESLIGLKKISSEESISVMNELLAEELYGGKAEEYYEFEEQIKKVRLEEVKSLAKELLKSYSTAEIVPK